MKGGEAGVPFQERGGEANFQLGRNRSLGVVRDWGERKDNGWYCLTRSMIRLEKNGKKEAADHLPEKEQKPVGSSGQGAKQKKKKKKI